MPRDESASVRAVIRVRPLLKHELDRGDESCIEVADAQSMLIRVGSGNQWRKYSFDACFPDDRSQKQLFQECGVTTLLDAAIGGYSATVLAYGQTGSGKTHTMLGPTETGGQRGDELKRDDGMIMRAARRLFKKMAEASNSTFSVSASFVEIFNAPGQVNECICDLLNPDAGNLQVRFSQKHGFFISDLATVDCRSVSDIRSVLEAGVQSRRVSAHALNRQSSRTHAMFTLSVDAEVMEPGEHGEPPTKTFGKITFVDLAGSERLKESLSEGDARKETQAINKSLFTLGQVISQLAQGQTAKHVPYRNSKLTQLLQESFGGSSLCLMVTCISPATAFAEESQHSLNYAQKAMHIQNSPVVRLDEQQQLVRDLRSENAALRRELEIYRSRFGELTPRGFLGATGGAVLGNTAAFLQTDAGAPRGAGYAGNDAELSRSRNVESDSRIPRESIETSATDPSSPVLSARGQSCPPPYTPQSPKPPAPVPANAPIPSLNSARGREGPGSYALAAAKRQQLKQAPVPRRRDSNKAQPKLLPPLPSRGSTAQLSSQGRGSNEYEQGNMGPWHNSEVQERLPSGEVNASRTSSAHSEERRMRRAQGVDLERTTFDDQQWGQAMPQDMEVSSERLQLTKEQLGRLDQAHWSEWQVHFGHHPGSADATKPPTSSRSRRGEVGIGSRSEDSGSELSGSSSDSRPSTAPRSTIRPSGSPAVASEQPHDKLGGKKTQETMNTAMLEARAVASTASGTPMDKGSDDNMSLEALNSRLASMQQATQALAK
eukprot:TRINITY_DN58802_c0_g1_i1.p1 TRINITY_DN58802_c0_g1~~TRINITY_DN58802_c0_g1_i1.p1  ORF type:complete len:775 (+),score=109.47 TRINITY_DN58802_c0_g1_i1:152-2476(+)